MTYSTTSGTRSTGLKERLIAFVAGLTEGDQLRRVYNRTVRELSQLNDRELADLGIHRSMIPQVAAEAAAKRA